MKQEPDKRYLVFEYAQHYPFGGLADMTESFDVLEEALRYANNSTRDFVDVYDRVGGVLIDIRNKK